MARPRLRQPKAQRLTIRMTVEEYDALCRLGFSHGRGLSELVRGWVRRELLSANHAQRPRGSYAAPQKERHVAPVA